MEQSNSKAIGIERLRRRRRASLADRYRDAQERGEPFVEMGPTEKPEDIKAKLDAEIAALRLEGRLGAVAYIPGVNLDSDDEQAHGSFGGGGADAWMTNL
jgi:hypothetical protein